MSEAVFTVIVPAYNREKTIEQTVKSVFNQSFSRWKMLIIDDASTDQTVKNVQPFLKDPRVRLIALSENKGISGVLNHALREVDTPYFVQLDSDDCLSRDALKRFYKESKKDPQAALLYGNVILWHKEKGKWVAKKRIRHRSFRSKYDFLTYMTYMLHPRCYRTEAARSVGGWDTDDPYGGRIMEDRRMVVKIIERYRIRWINRYLYHRRKHGKQLTNHATIKARNHLRRRLALDSLQRWGNRYRPEFGYRGRYLVVKRLIPQKKQ